MEEWEHVRMEYGNLPQIRQPKGSKVAAMSNYTLPTNGASSSKKSASTDFLVS